MTRKRELAVAAELEAEAAEYPDERGEILLEAAEAWQKAGETARAVELLQTLIEAGGEDGCYARCQLTELRFAEGDDAEAYAELERLSRDPALTDGHCTISAELLADRGDLAAAATWYDRAVARLSDEQLEALRGPDPWMRMEAVMLRGRRHVRRKLGLLPDAMDEIDCDSPWSLETDSDGEPLRFPVGGDGPSLLLPAAGGAPASRYPAPRLPADVDELRQLMDEGAAPPRQVRMLVFQRAERAEAQRRWPQEYGDPDEEHFPAAERRWRELAEMGVPSIRVVPATVAGLVEYAERTGGSPTDSDVKSTYSRTFPEENTIAWPPARNAPCWCGSGAKYKKCCGRAG